MKKEGRQKGFSLLMVIIALVIITIAVYGFMNRPGQIEQSKQIENKAIKDIEKINENIKINNLEIERNIGN